MFVLAGYVDDLMECVIGITSQQEDVDLVPPEVPPPLCASYEKPNKEVAVHQKTTRIPCPALQSTWIVYIVCVQTGGQWNPFIIP